MADKITMDDILQSGFGEASSKIRATFKKTMFIRSYETEVVEVQSELDMGDKELSGEERVLASAILQAQLEYETFCMLAYKGMVTTTELANRKSSLEDAINALKEKLEGLSGNKLDKYFNK